MSHIRNLGGVCVNTKNKTSIDIKKMTYLAILTAIVVVLQTVFAPMIGTATGGVLSPALVLIPFVLGAAVCGIGGGIWLGAVFALVVLIFDPSCAAFYAHNGFMTVVLVVLKSIAAGAVSGLIYKILAKKNKWLAIILAAISAPVANTGIFVSGLYVFFSGIPGFPAYITFAVTNFLVEFAVNLVFVPAIYKILEVSKIA